jgi:hypothetical protein
MRKLTVATVLCLIVTGCGSSSSKPHTATTGPQVVSTPAPTSLPTSFGAGYEQAWGEMKPVGADVRKVLDQVKRAQARHLTVPNSTLASEFAIFASRFEPALIEFQGLKPPASVAGAYRSMATAAAGVEAALRNLSTAANANKTSLAARYLASYFSYAMTVDKAALTIYNKLGLT